MKNIIFTLIFIAGLFIGLESTANSRLNSLPTAQATIYLDFDGHTVIHPFWNAGFPLHCDAAELSEEQITEIFNRVAEDFRPFDVNITTDSLVFMQAPLNMRTRVIVTPTSNWYQNVGGVSFIGSFTWGDDTPSFVFSDRLQHNPKFVAECITHESGHAVGLSHQSAYDQQCQLTEPYAMGAGSGEIGWAPVMGNSYYRNMTGWYNGPTPYGCSLTQDNLTIITTQNGFGYREDDYNDLFNENTFQVNELSFSHEGVITQNTDKDVFKYTLSKAAMVHIEARPFGLNNSSDGANLDVLVEVYNQDHELINTYNPPHKMNVTIDTLLEAGTYFFVVSGTGNQFGSDYGSLGSYTITGARGALPIHDVRLSGTVTGTDHHLAWNIVSDEPIAEQILQVSFDGINYETVAMIDAADNYFTYTPTKTGNHYYRLKVLSVVGQNALSNTIVLASPLNTKPYIVPTIVDNHIRVRGGNSFTYTIADYLGRVIRQGQTNSGEAELDASRLPAGMYLLILRNGNTKQIERIIKQ